jgi:uncharacterized protein YkwD
MKRNLISRTAAALGLTIIMVLSAGTAAMASANPESPAIARTKAWDSVKSTLGGVPESVRKIEYAGSAFYLGKDVTEENFLAVIAAGPEAVRLKPPVAANVSRMFFYPIYILWNSDKTALLVHPIIYAGDDILEAVAIPADPPASLTGSEAASETPKPALTEAEAREYMLSAEYADAVRNEFYRLLNEHRLARELRKLEVNPELRAYADIRADEQRTRSGHTRPDGSYAGSGWHNSYNHLNSRYAENSLSTGAVSADPKDEALKIFTGWKESKGHNKHFLYRFDSRITMALGIAPKLDDDGYVKSGAIFATGY